MVANRAEARGAATIRAETLAVNRRVQRLMGRLWPEARPRFDGSLYIWDVPVRSAPQQPSAVA